MKAVIIFDSPCQDTMSQAPAGQGSSPGRVEVTQLAIPK